MSPALRFRTYDRLQATATASPEVKELLLQTKLLLLATWGFYPIAYAMPLLGVGGAAAVVYLQCGYSIADILAKCGYGFMIYNIAKAKMEDEGTPVEANVVSLA